MKLFVVTGEQGEYSDRTTWISGVYETEAEAQAAIDAAAARRREWDNWHLAYLREIPAAGAFRAFTDEQQARARAALPAAPPYERAETASYEEAELGVWK